MKIYEIIETSCYDGTFEGVSTKVFLDEEKARNYFKVVADSIEDEVRDRYETVGTDDSEADAVLIRDAEHCSAYESWSSMNWDMEAVLMIHEVA